MKRTNKNVVWLLFFWLSFAVTIVTLTLGSFRRENLRASPTITSFRGVKLYQAGAFAEKLTPLDEPTFVVAGQNADQTTWIRDDAIVVGVFCNEVAKAYPLQILYWHEIVNDNIGGLDICITYCSLANSVVVFRRQYGGRVYRFRDSGLIFESNLVLTDKVEEHLWYQLTGEYMGSEVKTPELDSIPFGMVAWGEWKKYYPNTLLLSFETGFVEHYESNYARYPHGVVDHESLNGAFGISRFDSRLDPYQMIVGVLDGTNTYAVPIELRGRRESMPLADFHESMSFTEPGTIHCYSFWFAWQAAYPGENIQYSF